MHIYIRSIVRTNLLFGCELSEDGDRSKHAGARYGELYILVQYVHLLVLRDCNHSHCTERIRKL